MAGPSRRRPPRGSARSPSRAASPGRRCAVAVGAAEQRRVDRQRPASRGRDLVPAGPRRVPGLDAEDPRDSSRAGRSRCAGVRPPEIVAAALADDLPHERAVHQRSAPAASRRGRSRRARSRRARRGGRSACRVARAGAPAGSSARRSAARRPCPTWSASASAASFALWISAASSSSRTVSRSPARRLALDSPTLAAGGLTVTTSDGFVRSTVSSTVISLVMLAIGTRAWASRDAAPRRSAPFSTTKGGRVTCGGAASTGAASARAAAAKRRPFKRPASLFDADALPDDQVRRLDSRVQREQLLDASCRT